MMQADREYAAALFMLAAEENSIEEYLDALNIINKLISDQPEYIDFLASPAISLSERVQALDDAFGESMPENVVSFLKLLCENGVVRSLSGCISEYGKLAMAMMNRAIASVYSAVPLSDGQKTAICARLEKMTGKSVDPMYFVDESLIGGVRIEVEGKTYDGTIKHRLQEVKDVIIG